MWRAEIIPGTMTVILTSPDGIEQEVDAMGNLTELGLPSEAMYAIIQALAAAGKGEQSAPPAAVPEPPRNDFHQGGFGGGSFKGDRPSWTNLPGKGERPSWTNMDALFNSRRGMDRSTGLPGGWSPLPWTGHPDEAWIASNFYARQNNVPGAREDYDAWRDAQGYTPMTDAQRTAWRKEAKERMSNRSNR